MTDDELKFFISGSVNAAFDSLLRALSLTHTSKYTLFSWLDFWYIEFKEKHIPPFSESGLYQIRNCIDKHIKGNFDNKPLHELTALDCMTAINKISSSRMAVYAYDTLNDSLTRAVVFGELRENPLLKVDKPKHKREKNCRLQLNRKSCSFLIFAVIAWKIYSDSTFQAEFAKAKRCHFGGPILILIKNVFL